MVLCRIYINKGRFNHIDYGYVLSYYAYAATTGKGAKTLEEYLKTA